MCAVRAEDDRLREMLRHADIGKRKKLMAPLITSISDKKHLRKRLDLIGFFGNVVDCL